MTDKTIKIFVDGGCVTDVFNLPDGFDYAIIDSDVQEDLPTFEVTQIAKVKYTWIVQAKNKEEAEDQAMTSEADNEELIETLGYWIYGICNREND